MPRRHGGAWSQDEESRLYEAFVNGSELETLAGKHERTIGAIKARLEKLGLIDPETDTNVSPSPPFKPSSTNPDYHRSAAQQVNAIDIYDKEIGCWPIDGFPSCEKLSLRARRILQVLEIPSLYGVLTCPPKTFLRQEGCGASTLQEIFCAAWSDLIDAPEQKLKELRGLFEPLINTTIPDEQWASVEQLLYLHQRGLSVTVGELQGDQSSNIDRFASLDESSFADKLNELIDELLDRLGQIVSEAQEFPDSRLDAIIAGRFSISRDDALTLRELGAALGMSRTRISQLENRVRNRLVARVFSLSIQAQIEQISRRSHHLSFDVLTNTIISAFTDWEMSQNVRVLLLAGTLRLFRGQHISIRQMIKKTRTELSQYIQWKRITDHQLRRQNRKSTMANVWLDRINIVAQWPAADRRPDPSFLERNRFVRKAGDDDFGELSEFDSEKLKRVICFESKEEYRALCCLEACELVERYDTQTLRLTFKDNEITRRYHPDIVVKQSDGRVLVLEIKDHRVLATYDVLLKAYHATKILHSAGYGYHLTSFDGRCLATIQNIEIPSDIESAFLFSLDAEGCLKSKDLFAKFEGCTDKSSLLQAVVLKHKLYFRARPFAVERRADLNAAVFEQYQASFQEI